MKVACFFFFLLFISYHNSYSQFSTQNFRYIEESKNLSEAELKDQCNKYNFSKLLNHTDNSVVYGFIGNDYQRIRIKFISISKNPSSSELYNVYGKSMVKNSIDEFHGIIKISKILRLKVIKHGCENGYLFKGMKGEYSILGDYTFSENKNQTHSGVFKGNFRSDYFINKQNNIQYDDIENCSDGYANNQFIGEWKSYDGNTIQKCNWGDFRIPNSGDLDIGAGEFSPGDKYLANGWQSLRNYSMQAGPKYKQAKKIEEAKWWQ